MWADLCRGSAESCCLSRIIQKSYGAVTVGDQSPCALAEPKLQRSSPRALLHLTAGVKLGPQVQAVRGKELDVGQHGETVGAAWW